MNKFLILSSLLALNLTCAAAARKPVDSDPLSERLLSSDVPSLGIRLEEPFYDRFNKVCSFIGYAQTIPVLPTTEALRAAGATNAQIKAIEAVKEIRAALEAYNAVRYNNAIPSEIVKAAHKRYDKALTASARLASPCGCCIIG